MDSYGNLKRVGGLPKWCNKRSWRGVSCRELGEGYQAVVARCGDSLDEPGYEGREGRYEPFVMGSTLRM